MLTIKNPFKGELDSIVEDSARVLDVFSKTVNELTSINTRVDAEKAVKLEEKAQLEEQIAILTVTQEKNAKVISKIENLLN